MTEHGLMVNFAFSSRSVSGIVSAINRNKKWIGHLPSTAELPSRDKTARGEECKILSSVECRKRPQEDVGGGSYRS